MQVKTIKVHFAPHLRRFIDLPVSCEATGASVRDLINDLEAKFSGISDYLLHENGTMRQHVNLFLDQRMITDREKLSDSVLDVDEIHIIQALSGG